MICNYKYISIEFDLIVELQIILPKMAVQILQLIK